MIANASIDRVAHDSAAATSSCLPRLLGSWITLWASLECVLVTAAEAAEAWTL